MKEPMSSDEDRSQPDRAGGRDDDAGEVAMDPEFLVWRAGLPSFVIDDERLYLPTGDIPMDDREVAEYWRRLKASKPPHPESSG
jgi:hypothetical protein